jgi:hypothetical protein
VQVEHATVDHIVAWQPLLQGKVAHHHLRNLYVLSVTRESPVNQIVEGAVTFMTNLEGHPAVEIPLLLHPPVASNERNGHANTQ